MHSTNGATEPHFIETASLPRQELTKPWKIRPEYQESSGVDCTVSKKRVYTPNSEDVITESENKSDKNSSIDILYSLQRPVKRC